MKLSLVGILMLGALENVLSLKCYSCFSYLSHKDCENRYNLKEIDCGSSYDTCVKITFDVAIREHHGDKARIKNNKAYARHCGMKSKCKNDVDSLCQFFYHPNDARIKQCKVDCCYSDLEAKCNLRPGWPGTDGSSAIFTNNKTNNNDAPGKGARGLGAQLTGSIWSLVIVLSVALIVL